MEFIAFVRHHGHACALYSDRVAYPCVFTQKAWSVDDKAHTSVAIGVCEWRNGCDPSSGCNDARKHFDVQKNQLGGKVAMHQLIYCLLKSSPVSWVPQPKAH